jgi:adenylate kinase family enzyme
MTRSNKNSKSKVQNPKVIILIGRSGSGKGTHAKLLKEELDLEYLGTGDLLRAQNSK